MSSIPVYRVEGNCTPTGSSSTLSWTDLGTSSLGTGEMATSVTPVPVEDIPDLRVVTTLHRPYYNLPTYTAPSLFGRIVPAEPTVVKMETIGRVEGEEVRMPLSAKDMRGIKYGAMIVERRAQMLFRLRYPLAQRPDLFDGLTPAGPHVFTPEALFGNPYNKQGVRGASPGALYPPGIVDLDPWVTVKDQPMLEFYPQIWRPHSERGRNLPIEPNTCPAAWVWRENPGAEIMAAAAWDDMEALSYLVDLLREPEMGKACAWLFRNATD